MILLRFQWGCWAGLLTPEGLTPVRTLLSRSLVPVARMLMLALEGGICSLPPGHLYRTYEMAAVFLRSQGPKRRQDRAQLLGLASDNMHNYFYNILVMIEVSLTRCEKGYTMAQIPTKQESWGLIRTINKHRFFYFFSPDVSFPSLSSLIWATVITSTQT